MILSFPAVKKLAKVNFLVLVREDHISGHLKEVQGMWGQVEVHDRRKAHTATSLGTTTDEVIVVVKNTFDSFGGQSYEKIAADMGCTYSTTCRTIKQSDR